MSKLDNILLGDVDGRNGSTLRAFAQTTEYAESKADIKALMLELIGEDVTIAPHEKKGTISMEGLFKSRNQLRAELRKKVEEL